MNQTIREDITLGLCIEDLIEDKQIFPKEGTRTELEEIGARYLSTKNFQLKGSKTKIEYMIYEENGKAVVWKKFKGEKTYKIHIESLVTKKY